MGPDFHHLSVVLLPSEKQTDLEVVFLARVSCIRRGGCNERILAHCGYDILHNNRKVVFLNLVLC